MFEPPQNDYTNGFLKGRLFERDQIVTLLEDWTLNAQWTWADIYEKIDNGLDTPVISRQAHEAELFDAVNRERERIVDAIAKELDKLQPALDADHNPVIDPVRDLVLGAIYGQSSNATADIHS